MKIRIITIGKVKNDNIKKIIDEYLKKISHFNQIEVVSIEEKNFKDETQDNIKKTMTYEAEKISKYLNESFNIALCIEGNELDSISLSKKIDSIITTNSSKKYLNFIIGGSYGLDNSVKEKTDLKLSFSKMTFNHQIFQIILLEQIYRSFTIMKNISYHK